MDKDHKDIGERKKEVTRRKYFYLLPKLCLTKSGECVLKRKKIKCLINKQAYGEKCDI